MNDIHAIQVVTTPFGTVDPHLGSTRVEVRRGDQTVADLSLDYLCPRRDTGTPLWRFRVAGDDGVLQPRDGGFEAAEDGLRALGIATVYLVDLSDETVRRRCVVPESGPVRDDVVRVEDLVRPEDPCVDADDLCLARWAAEQVNDALRRGDVLAATGWRVGPHPCVVTRAVDALVGGSREPRTRASGRDALATAVGVDRATLAWFALGFTAQGRPRKRDGGLYELHLLFGSETVAEKVGRRALTAFFRAGGRVAVGSESVYDVWDRTGRRE